MLCGPANPILPDKLNCQTFGPTLPKKGVKMEAGAWGHLYFNAVCVSDAKKGKTTGEGDEEEEEAAG